MEYSLKYSFKCIESVSSASYAGSDSRAEINDSAPGKVCPKAALSVSRTLGSKMAGCRSEEAPVQREGSVPHRECV